MRALVAVALLASTTAAADRGWHGSVGGGGSLLAAGGEGDTLRADLEIDLKPRSRYGGALAWRWFDQDHKGAVIGGLVFEGAAARPRLVVDLHADVGADLDQKVPILGGGIRTTLTIVGPLGVVLDGGVYLVADGFDDSRVVVATNTLIVLRW